MFIPNTDNSLLILCSFIVGSWSVFWVDFTTTCSYLFLVGRQIDIRSQKARWGNRSHNTKLNLSSWDQNPRIKKSATSRLRDVFEDAMPCSPTITELRKGISSIFCCCCVNINIVIIFQNIVLEEMPQVFFFPPKFR